jgi:hypothetical protein
MWLRRLCHLLLIHALVDHTGYFAIAPKGKPADSVLGRTVMRPEFEQRKPGIEEQVEFIYLHFENACEKKVPELVHKHKDGQAKY